MGDTALGKFMNSGPDWIDIATMISGLEQIHGVRVELTVTIPGQGHNGLLDTTILAWVPTVEAHHTSQVAKITRQYPDKIHRDYAHAVFAQLYELDKAIGAAYKQGSF